MEGPDRDRRSAGFKERTRVAEARAILRAAVRGAAAGPVVDAGRVPLASADRRVLAEQVTAERDVPHYERAAMDGYAVRATDTHGASDRSPAVLRLAGESADEPGSASVEPGTAVRVHTGSALPRGADAVVMIERVTALPAVGELEVEDAVAAGENVAPVGEDVTAGTTLYEPGHRLRPSDLGLLRSAGVECVAVAERPTVAVIPTGEELVEAGAEPAPGQVVETNGLTVSRLAERWGGRPTHRDVVTDDPEALRSAIERDLARDVVVTTGGSSVGQRDRLPEAIADLGEVLVHGVALKPGHPVCLGVVEETPVLALPGYPVACIVNAVQFLRPTLRWLDGAPVEAPPTVGARLDRKIPSEPGTRTFARVRLDRVPAADAGTDDGSAATDDGGPTGAADDGGPTGAADDGGTAGGDDPAAGDDGPSQRAIPTRASGSGVLSSVALADGWVVVDEEREGIPAGETVDVELWE